MVTVAGTMLLVPLVLAALNLPMQWGVSAIMVCEFFSRIV